MSCSKPLPPFVCDSLYYLNRDQLERFTIVCRSLKKFIDRYFHSKPYRIFDRLTIRGGSYVLRHNGVQWHPNQDDYSVQQFIAGQKCSIEESKNAQDFYNIFYSFAEMCPYLGPTIRIESTYINATAGFTYNPEHIAEMESLAYLWCDGTIYISKANYGRIVAEDFQPILDSPTILQCRYFCMRDAHFSFKDYKVLYAVKVEIHAFHSVHEYAPNYWPEFLEEPGVKPIVNLITWGHQNVENLLNRLSQAFLSAVVQNAFKINFFQDEPLTEFRKTNTTSGEKLELKKNRDKEDMEDYDSYTLERSSI